MDTRRKNKAEENKATKTTKEKQKKETNDSTNNYTTKNQISSALNYHLKIESKLKGIIENFINQEIKKDFTLMQYSSKKIKSHYEFDIKLNTEEDCDQIISLFFNHSEFKDKKDIKIFKDKTEINRNDFEIVKKEEINNAQNIKAIEDNASNLIKENEKAEVNNQITIENVPDSLDKEKIFDIFFIYGDILEILLKKEEKKCFIAFKYDSSADKALRKYNKSPKNYTIRKSFEYEKLQILQNYDYKNSTPEVVYIKFIKENFINEDEMKKLLKKYCEVQKIARKIEGRSYFILFKESGIAAKLVKDYKKGLFSIKNFNVEDLIIDYAYAKTDIENKLNIEKDKEYDVKTETVNKIQEIEKDKEPITQEASKQKTTEFEADKKTKEIETRTELKADQIKENDITNNNLNNLNLINEPSNTNQNITTAEAQFETLDINKFWQTYFDQTYNRNYYYNPFLNESVWELPPGASTQEYQNQTDQSINNNLASNSLTETNANILNTDHNTLNAINQTIHNQQQNLNLDLNFDNKENNDNLSQNSYYDEEAWEEDELREKIVWDKLKQSQLAEWLKRPARKQVSDTRRDTAYIEGNYDYNIWYDKYLTDRKEEKEKIPAMHRCNPALDTGFTKADLQEKEGGAYFCLYFAKGCCSEGVNCRYYHRVPTKEDAEKIENLRDVFGRSRFATHRSDMGGVGTFTRDCRTLYVSDLKMVDSANPIKDMIRIIYDNFSPWGEVEDINYIPTKAACFIRFSHRCFAEFAKEGMMDQSLVGEEILGVKWAFDDPNPMMKKKVEKEHENRFLNAHLKRQENKAELIKKKRLNPNTDYFGYYNNRNNPYAVNNQGAIAGNAGFGYESGYGYDDSLQNSFGFDANANDENRHQQITNNCVKLSETLRMIDQNFNNQNN